MSVIEVKVPDIGDFKDIPVIEVLVKPGDTVGKEAPLVTWNRQGDHKVPCHNNGEEIKVKIGDKVSRFARSKRLPGAGAGCRETGSTSRLRATTSAQPRFARGPAPIPGFLTRRRGTSGPLTKGGEAGGFAQAQVPPCGASRASWAWTSRT
jgi:hypothetical protein